MLLPLLTLVLAAQLIIAVANDVPKFNIERGCKIDGTATSLDVGLSPARTARSASYSCACG